MPSRRSKFALKAVRDGGIGLAVYSGIAILALEDRAQTGSALPTLPKFNADTGLLSGTDPSVLTLFVLGLLFALLTAFTLTGWRHFGQNFALARVRPDRAQNWSISTVKPYRKKA